MKNVISVRLIMCALLPVLFTQFAYCQKSNKRSSVYYYKLSYKVKGSNKIIAALKEAVKINPKYAQAHSRLCAFYSIENEHKTAEMHCQAAARYGGLNSTYYWQVAQNYYNQGKYNLAINKAKEALQFDEFNAKLYAVKADSYLELGSFTKAIEEYTNAINFNSTNPYYYANRALAYIYTGQDQAYQEAYYDYNKAVKINPKFAPGYAGRGETNMALGRVSSGIKDLKKAIALDPKSPHPYRILGYYYFENSDYKNAKANFLKMYKYDTNNPETHLYMGIYYIAVKNKEKALISLENAFKTGFENIKQIEDPHDGFGKYFARLANDPRYREIIEKWKEKIHGEKGVVAVEIYK